MPATGKNTVFSAKSELRTRCPSLGHTTLAFTRYKGFRKRLFVANANLYIHGLQKIIFFSFKKSIKGLDRMEIISFGWIFPIFLTRKKSSCLITLSICCETLADEIHYIYIYIYFFFIIKFVLILFWSSEPCTEIRAKCFWTKTEIGDGQGLVHRVRSISWKLAIF